MITVTFFVLGLLVLLYGMFGWVPYNPLYFITLLHDLENYCDSTGYHHPIARAKRNVDKVWRAAWIISGLSMMILSFFYDSVLILLLPLLIPVCVSITGFIIYYTIKCIFIVLAIFALTVLAPIIHYVFYELIYDENEKDHWFR